MRLQLNVTMLMNHRGGLCDQKIAEHKGIMKLKQMPRRDLDDGRRLVNALLKHPRPQHYPDENSRVLQK